MHFSPSDTPATVSPERQRWLSLLATTPPELLQAHWVQLPTLPQYRVLRPAELGLVMVQGRAGGTGTRFCLGEMTVSRCIVRSAAGHTGLGYVQGRALAAAEQAAVLDALLQDEASAPLVQRSILDPLDAAQAARHQARAAEAEATRVDFFTLVRGEDA